MANKHPNTSGLRRGRVEKYGNLPDDLGHMRWVMNRAPEEDTTDAQRRWRKLMDEDFKTFTMRKQAAEALRKRYMSRHRPKKDELPPEDDFDDMIDTMRANARTRG